MISGTTHNAFLKGLSVNFISEVLDNFCLLHPVAIIEYSPFVFINSLIKNIVEFFFYFMITEQSPRSNIAHSNPMYEVSHLLLFKTYPVLFSLNDQREITVFAENIRSKYYCPHWTKAFLETIRTCTMELFFEDN